jgi:hypothetical protein
VDRKKRKPQEGSQQIMYALSRALYKDISPYILNEPVNPAHGSNRAQVLQACEETMERVADDWRYFNNPERFLFEQVRPFFPITEQLRVFNLIDRHIQMAVSVAKTYAARGFKPDGTRLRCRATTRRSTPCMRNIVPGTEYCPSHQHLAEPHFDRPGRDVAVAGRHADAA